MRNPLMERLKFVAIYGTNLDEFFMIRVAAIKQQIEAQVDAPFGRRPYCRPSISPRSRNGCAPRCPRRCAAQRPAASRAANARESG